MLAKRCTRYKLYSVLFEFGERVLRGDETTLFVTGGTFVRGQLEGVSFTPRGFEIEDQVLHVEPGEHKSFPARDQEFTPATLGAVDHAEHQRLKPRANFGRQRGDPQRPGRRRPWEVLRWLWQ